MRDPERITGVLEAVERAWRANPDLRLAQLLWSAAPTYPDPFYVEDDKLVIGLKALAQ